MQTNLEEEAGRLLAEQKLPEAQQVIDELLVLNPESLDYKLAAIQVAQDLYEFKKSQQHLQQLTEEDKKNPQARYYQARQFVYSNQYTTLLYACQEQGWLEQTPSPELYWLAARSASCLGRWSEAQQLLQTAQERWPNTPLFLAESSLLQATFPRGSASLAWASILPLFATEQQDLQLVLIATRIALLAQQQEAAAQLLHWLEQRHPQQVEVLTLKAAYCLAAGQVGSAGQLIIHTLNISEHLPLSHWVASKVMKSQGYLDDAIWYMRKATRQQPAFFAETEELADLTLKTTHEITPTLDYLLKVQQVNPGEGRLYAKASYLYLLDHQLEMAEQQLEQGFAQSATGMDALYIAQAALEAKKENWHTQASLFHTLNPQADFYGALDYTNTLVALHKRKNSPAEKSILNALKEWQLSAYFLLLAQVLERRGKRAQAIKKLQAYLEHHPHHYELHERLIELLIKDKRMEDADMQEWQMFRHVNPEVFESKMQAAIAENPDLAEPKVKYALYLSNRPGREKEVMPLIDELIALAKENPANLTYRNRSLLGPDALLRFKGMNLNALERFEEAIPFLQEALELSPKEPRTLLLLMRSYFETGKLKEAEYCLETLKQEKLPLDDKTGNDLAILLKDMYGSSQEVVAVYDFVLKNNKEDYIAAYNRSLTLLSLAKTPQAFFSAFDDFERYGFISTQRQPNRQFNVPRWNGESLAGKRLLIWREQGIGDELAAAMHLPEVIQQAQQQGGQVVLECTPRLKTLFKSSFPEIDIFEQSHFANDLARSDIDYHCPICSLPNIKPCSFIEPPQLQSIVRIDEQTTQKWQERVAALGSGLKIGLCWRSGRRDATRNRGYAELEELLPLLQTPGVHWVNLAYVDYKEEIAALEEKHGITIHLWDDLDLRDDFYNTAALTQELDLVIGPASTPSVMGRFCGVVNWLFVYGAEEANEQPRYLPRAYPALTFRRYYSESFNDIANKMKEKLIQYFPDLDEGKINK